MKLHSLHNLFFLSATNCFFCLFCGIYLHAQNNLRFETFTSANGLSENVVYSIFQDTKGYLWIGTDDGLNRYDGYKFKNFRYSAFDSNSLPNNRVNDICEDENGDIWFATSGGLGKYSYITGKFNRCALQGVGQIISLNKNELMIRNENSLCLINVRTFKKTTIGFWNGGKLNLRITTSTPLSCDKKRNIYLVQSIAETKRLYKYDSVSRSFNEIPGFSSGKNLSKDQITFFLSDNHGGYWIGTERGKLMNNLTGEKFVDLPTITKPSSSIKSIYEDNNGNIWIGTEKEGLLFYNYATKKFSYYKHKPFINAISSDNVNTIYEDKTGNIWIGTFAGLNKLNPLEQKFTHLFSGAGNLSLFNNFILGIYRNNNEVSIEYLYGIPFFSRFDVTDNSIKHYSIRDCSFFDYIKNVALKNPEDLNDLTFKKLLPNLHKIEASITPGNLIVDNKQNLWCIMDHEFVNISTLRKWNFGFHIVDMKVYNNEVWLASADNGLICFDLDTQKIIKFFSWPSNPNSINSNDITCFLIEKNRDMWIGTKGGGINYFERKKKVFRHYTEENGLCNNSIYSMVKDNKGRLWLGTSNGLSCFDTSTYKFRNYFLSDGLINSEYNRYSACLLKDGSLLMGGMNGIDYFHPDSVIDDNKKSQVQITDFKVFNKSIFPAQSFSLSHDENSITIEFAVMDFKNLSGDKFAYKLKGVDKDWVMLKNRNFATYSTLSPGHYHFLVKAVNSNGVWNEQAASIDFTIKTPWWRSWWFYSGCLLIVGILLGAFYRFRINQLKRLMALRTKISQDLHDEVGATLSGIAMYSHLIRRQLKAGQSEKVEYSLGVIQQSASEMVNKLSDIVWLVNPRHDSIGNIIQKLEDYATEMAMVKNIRMTSSVSDKIADLKLPMEARRNIYLLCKEAINNSIKYSNCSLLHLRVQMYDHTLEYELQDNGIGFNFHEVKRGNGLNNMEQRANEIGATLKIVSATGKGTRITLQHKISQ